jgi:hypothetical protein
MCGSEAKSPDNIEQVLGLVPAESALVTPRPGPRLGLASIATPVLSFLIGWLLGALLQRHDGSGAAWVPVHLFCIAGLTLIGSVAGGVLAACALWRVERFIFIGAFGLAANGAIVLSFFRLFFG